MCRIVNSLNVPQRKLKLDEKVLTIQNSALNLRDKKCMILLISKKVDICRSFENKDFS